MSRRTDGQPIRVPSGGDYGARQQLESQQRAQRLPEGPNAPQPGTAAGGQQGEQQLAQPPGQGGLGDVFAPTARPEEPPQRGQDPVIPEDPDETLRAVYSVTRSEDIRRLLEWRENMRSRPPPEPPRERRTPGKRITPKRPDQPPQAAANAPPTDTEEIEPGTPPEPTPASGGPLPTPSTGQEEPLSAGAEPPEPPPGEGV